jgi:WD40 repeat protein
LALGTTLREVALYEQEGLGRCTSVFSLESGAGTGVTNVEWSPCGKYLLVAERQSDVVQVYDIRDTHQKVATLSGRNANTTQTLNIDVLPTASGYEVWGGGLDGKVRMWKDPGSKEGKVGVDAEFKVADGKCTLLNRMRQH